MQKYLIVNADDFGQSHGVNRGIVRAHRNGVVTSASLMVHGAAAAAAAAKARENPWLGVGLHIDLGEWMYRDGGWEPVYEVVALDDARAVEREADRQLAIFLQLTGHEPTHLDSHQHVHLREPLRPLFERLAERLNVYLRGANPEVHYCSAFYGQTNEGQPLPDKISLQALLDILDNLPTGVTELGCHPAEGDDLDTMYRCERAHELKVLCDWRVRAKIETLGIGLRSFADTHASGSWAARTI